jgi:hypothetical protein
MLAPKSVCELSDWSDSLHHVLLSIVITYDMLFSVTKPRAAWNRV